jgi:hypothetical protein
MSDRMTPISLCGIDELDSRRAQSGSVSASAAVCRAKGQDARPVRRAPRDALRSRRGSTNAAFAEFRRGLLRGLPLL